MTDTNNGWPGKPGVPLNPTEDEPHWLSWRDEKPRAVEWDSQSLAPVEDKDKQGFWRFSDLYGTPEQVAADGWRYLGPCLTPDEATALQARADRNAAGFARVDAEAERAKFLHKQEIEALQKRVAELEAIICEKVVEIAVASSYGGECTECHWAVSAWNSKDHRDDCWYVKARAAIIGPDGSIIHNCKIVKSAALEGKKE